MAGTATFPEMLYRCVETAPKALALATAAGLLAGAGAFASGQAVGLKGSSLPSAATFAERFLGAPGEETDCTQKSWPYFAEGCLRMPDGTRVRAVRIIAVDRHMPGARMLRLAR